MEGSSEKTLSTKRFVVEDTFTKVTSDGEPHGMLTMIAGLSGLLAAIVILAILISLIACKKKTKKNPRHCRNCPSSLNSQKFGSTPSTPTKIAFYRQRSSILSLLRRVSSIAEDSLNEESESGPRLLSVSSISHGGNLEGNLNTAFMGSELHLSSSFSKKLPECRNESKTIIKETAIDMERY